MARLTEYNFEFLKEYNCCNVIYALYTDEQGIRYVGYSKRVYDRFKNHLANNDSESNCKKRNWIEKYKKDVKIQILSINPKDWESEEKKYINKYSENNLLNICEGGKNNIRKKDISQMSCEEIMIDSNKTLRELNRYLKSKGRTKVFKLFTKEEIKTICNFPINKK